MKALVTVSDYLIGSQQSGTQPLPPQTELQWWYQYYFATARGRAGERRHAAALGSMPEPALRDLPFHILGEQCVQMRGRMQVVGEHVGLIGVGRHIGSRRT